MKQLLAGQLCALRPAAAHYHNGSLTSQHSWFSTKRRQAGLAAQTGRVVGGGVIGAGAGAATVGAGVAGTGTGAGTAGTEPVVGSMPAGAAAGACR